MKSFFLFNFLLVLALFSFNFAQEESSEIPSARVVLYKYTDTNPVVEGNDFVITYQLVNLGNAVASSIEVADRYDANSFETISNVDSEGIVTFSYEELAPGAQTSLNVTIRPKLSGVYDSTRARLKYSFEEVSMDGVEPEYKHGYSTSLGRVKIITQKEFARNEDYFTRQWIIFISLAAFPVLFPFYLWNKSKSN